VIRASGVAIIALAISVTAQEAPGQTTSGARAEESRTLALATQMGRSGQTAEAERVLIELLASQPTAAGALAMLAQLGADRGAPDLVLPYAEAAAERAGYEQATIHQILIRALVDSGLADEALDRAREWVAARPTDTAGYAELSSAYGRLGYKDDAIRVLAEARERADDDDLFSQELALLHLAVGDSDAAAREWLRVLAWGDAGVAAVVAHLRTPGVESEAMIVSIRRALDGPDVALTSRRGGLELAMAIDRPEWSRQLAETLADQAPFDMRWQLLRKYYLDARDAGYVPHARWAAGRLAAEATDPGDRQQWEAVEASLAMEEGDRDHADRAFDRVLAESARGSETRRLALQSLVVLRADRNPDAAERLIGTHAAEFPEREGDLADMVIRLSQAHVRRDDLNAANRVLELAPSQPKDASTVARLAAQRGYLALFGGDVGLARTQLEIAGFIHGGAPGERTEVLLFLDAFDRADSLDVSALGQGIYALQSGKGPTALLRLTEEWASAPIRAPSAGLMRLAAGALEKGEFDSEAEAVRLSLVETFPAASETPGALLSLARTALRGRPAESRRWLQRLIIDHPESALAPVARRLLSELDRRVPAGASGSEATAL